MRAEAVDQAVDRLRARARAAVCRSQALVVATRCLQQTLRDARVARWLDGLDRENDRAARLRACSDGPRGAGPAR